MIFVHLTVPIRISVNVLTSNRPEALQDGRDGGESQGRRVKRVAARVRGKKEEGGE